jgi:hypothetical protein
MTRTCSFCGRDQYEVRKLLVGPFNEALPYAAICIECLVRCIYLMGGDLIHREHLPKEVLYDSDTG